MSKPTQEETRELFRQKFAEIEPHEIQAVVGLANAQLRIERLREEDPTWTTIIRRPQDSADATSLRAILEAAAAFGVIPDEDRANEYADLLASGAYLRMPPYDR